MEKNARAVDGDYYSPPGTLHSTLNDTKDAILLCFREGFDLPIWKLPDTHPFHDHVTNLAIPQVSAVPSLLLHRLGEPNAAIERRIRHLFSDSPKTK
jgi:hypothetical protein